MGLAKPGIFLQGRSQCGNPQHRTMTTLPRQHQDLDKGATNVSQCLPVGDIVPGRDSQPVSLSFVTSVVGNHPWHCSDSWMQQQHPCAHCTTASYLTWVHSQAHTLKWPNSAASEIKFFKVHENRLPGKENRGFLFPLWKRGRLSVSSQPFHCWRFSQVLS